MSNKPNFINTNLQHTVGIIPEKAYRIKVEIPLIPSDKTVCLLAGVILGQPYRTCDNRSPLWDEAVKRAALVYKTVVDISSEE